MYRQERGHRPFPYGSYNSKRNICCPFTGGGYGPAHTVSLIVTHNRSANQTYALASCGLNGRWVQARAELNGQMTAPVVRKNYAQTLSVCQPGDLTAYEMHRVELPR